MASATGKRSPGTDEADTEIHRSYSTAWTDEERAAVLNAGRNIQNSEHLHVRELLRRAMADALPMGRHQAVSKWPYDRIKWFVEGIQKRKEKPVPDAVVAEPAGRIRWDLEEKAELIAAGREIRRQHPKLRVNTVLERAQEEVLPSNRRRTYLSSIPPEKIKWYADAIDGEITEDALEELEPIRVSELRELPPLPAPEPEPRPDPRPTVASATLGKSRKVPVYWSRQELDLLLARSRELYEERGGDTMRSLIDRAQHDVLPPERHREVTTIANSPSGQYLLERMAEWPPHRAVRPQAAVEPDPVVFESARRALFDYAFPPPPPPEPVDVDSVVARAVEDAVAETESLGILAAETEDLVAELARRAFLGWRSGGDVIAQGFALLRSFQDTTRNHDHDLLMKIVGDLGLDPRAPAALPPAPAPATLVNGNGKHETPADVPAARPKLRGLLIGGAVDFGRDVVAAVKGCIDLEHNPNVNHARNKGFKNYDCVFATPIAGHSATKKAKSELGQENVMFISHVSATRIAEEIRKFVSKREAKTKRLVEAN